MKKLLVVLLIVVMSMCMFAACGGGDEEGTGEGEATDTYELRLTTNYNDGEPGYEMVEAACANIEEKTNGAVKITLYPGSVLGDYTLAYEELMKGTIDMALISIPGEYDPRLEMVFFPFLVENYAQLEPVFGRDSWFFQQFSGVNQELGVTCFGVYIDGFMGVATNKKAPVEPLDPDVNKDILLRCPPQDIFKASMEDIGYSTVTVAYAELYSALQTGVCEGCTGLTPQLVYNVIRDVTGYFVTYNNALEVMGLFGSSAVFDGMPEEYKTVVADEMYQVSLDSFAAAEQNDTDFIQQLADYGVEIIDLTDEERAALADTVRERSWPVMKDKLGDELYNGILDFVETL